MLHNTYMWLYTLISKGIIYRNVLSMHLCNGHFCSHDFWRNPYFHGHLWLSWLLQELIAYASWPYLWVARSSWRGLRLYAGGSTRQSGPASGAGTFHTSSNRARLPSSTGSGAAGSGASSGSGAAVRRGFTRIPGSAGSEMGGFAPVLLLLLASPTERRSESPLLGRATSGSSRGLSSTNFRRRLTCTSCTSSGCWVGGGCVHWRDWPNATPGTGHGWLFAICASDRVWIEDQLQTRTIQAIGCFQWRHYSAATARGRHAGGQPRRVSVQWR